MKRKATLLTAALLSLTTLAQNLTGTWRAPEQKEDGGSIAISMTFQTENKGNIKYIFNYSVEKVIKQGIFTVTIPFSYTRKGNDMTQTLNPKAYKMTTDKMEFVDEIKYAIAHDPEVKAEMDKTIEDVKAEIRKSVLDDDDNTIRYQILRLTATTLSMRDDGGGEITLTRAK